MGAKAAAGGLTVFDGIVGDLERTFLPRVFVSTVGLADWVVSELHGAERPPVVTLPPHFGNVVRPRVAHTEPWVPLLVLTVSPPQSLITCSSRRSGHCGRGRDSAPVELRSAAQLSAGVWRAPLEPVALGSSAVPNGCG